MPSRYIREGWLDSDAIARASAAPPSGGGPAAEVLFLRLCLIADDWGRCDGRPVVLIRSCWPAQDEFDGHAPSRAAVVDLLAILAREGLIVPYTADEKPYLVIPRFGQRTRAKVSKFPAPPGEVPTRDTGANGGWRDPEPGNPGPQNVGVTSAPRLTIGGHTADKARTGSGGPQAGSGSRTLSRTGLQAADKKPVDKTRKLIDSQRQDAEKATPPPGGSVKDFAKQAIRKLPAFTATAPEPEPTEEFEDEPDEPPQPKPHPLGAQPDQERIRTGAAAAAPPADPKAANGSGDIDKRAEVLGMERLPLESDADLESRISARLQLG